MTKNGFREVWKKSSQQQKVIWNSWVKLHKNNRSQQQFSIVFMFFIISLLFCYKFLRNRKKLNRRLHVERIKKKFKAQCIIWETTLHNYMNNFCLKERSRRLSRKSMSAWCQKENFPQVVWLRWYMTHVKLVPMLVYTTQISWQFLTQKTLFLSYCYQTNCWYRVPSRH